MSSTSSATPELVEVGQEIPGTGYKVVSIEPDLVKIVDTAGVTESLEFSLVSDSAMKRAEVTFKNELGRVKQFSTQNTFGNPSGNRTRVGSPNSGGTKTQNSQTGKPVLTGESSRKAREEAMRKRAEQLKQEMKELKDLRDKKKTKDSKKSDRDR